VSAAVSSPRGGEPAPAGVIVADALDPVRPERPHALAVVAGRTLLERAVLTLHEAGVEDIVVVIGHKRERVRELARARGLSVLWAENGGSASDDCSAIAAGARAAGRRFVLIGVNHVVEPEALRRLLSRDAAFAVGVDGDRGRGPAICDAALGDAAARCVADGETSWSALTRRWVGEGGAIDRVEIGELLWQTVDTPEARRRAEREIVRRTARKPYDGTVFRYVVRYLSWPISLRLVHAGVRPAVATAAAFVVALLAAVALGLGASSDAWLVAGAALVFAALLLDAVNGEIARAELRSSRAGAFFDSVLDRPADAALLVGLAVAAGLDRTTWIALTLALVGTLVAPYVNAAYEAVYRRAPPRVPLRVSFGRDARLLLITLSAAALAPFWGLLAVAILANLEVLQRIAGAARSGL
jgi:phosphatidylglycerophosphate synthase/CTP:molybdopterin cytidylyltransferase MocA